MTTDPTPRKSWHDDLPFPKRWLWYIALKFAVLAAAVLVALAYYDLL